MGYALFWIESLAAALLGTALVLSWSARRERALWRWLPATAAALLPFGFGAAAAIGTWLLDAHGMGSGWFGYSASWLAAFTIGAVALFRTALRGGAPMSAGRAWPTTRLAIAFVAALALQLMTLSNLDSAVRLQLAGLRSESGALALSVAPVRVNESDNAALVYERAFERLARLHPPTAEGKASEPLSDRLRAWTKGTGERLAHDDDEMLKTQERLVPVLTLLRRAAAMKDCVFEHDYARPRLDWLLPELVGMRRAAELLAFDARACALQYRAKEAVADLVAIRGIARHMRGNSPLLIGWLVACAIEATHVQALGNVLVTAQIGGTDLAPLLDEDPATYQKGLLRALRMEEAFGLSAWATLGEGDDPQLAGEVGPGAEWVLPLWRVFLLRDDLRSYRRMMSRCQEIGPKPYSESGTAWKELSAWATEHGSGLLTGLLTPALSHAAERAALTDARRSLARLAVAAELHRAATGSYPKSADELVPARLDEVPVDPFDGKPLRLRATEKALVLYSVGPNGLDDGGADGRGDDRAGDLVFALTGTKK